MAKAVKKLPATEIGAAVRCRTKSGQEYLISQNPHPTRSQDQFTLWRVSPSNLEWVSSSDAPTALYEQIVWND